MRDDVSRHMSSNLGVQMRTETTWGLASSPIQNLALTGGPQCTSLLNSSCDRLTAPRTPTAKRATLRAMFARPGTSATDH